MGGDAVFQVTASAPSLVAGFAQPEVSAGLFHQRRASPGRLNAIFINLTL
jgi:hypothetical protein